MPADLQIADQAAAMRAFNRFYTQRIGVLDDTPLNGPSR